MTSNEILEGTIDLIKGGWTQNALARMSNGCPVSPLRPEACSFCIEGAMLKTLGDHEAEFTSLEYDWVVNNLEELYGTSIEGWNDIPGRTHEEVVSSLESLLAEGTA